MVDELLTFGEVRRGWLGVGVELVTNEIARQVKGKAGKGVWVNSAFEGDPAYRAGLRKGDVILKIGGTDVDTPGRLIRLIAAFSPGQMVNIDILRDGKRKVFTVKLDNKKIKPKKIVKNLQSDPSEYSLGIEVEGFEKWQRSCCFDGLFRFFCRKKRVIGGRLYPVDEWQNYLEYY